MDTKLPTIYTKYMPKSDLVHKRGQKQEKGNYTVLRKIY
jgi:hypothetical protein